MNEKLTNQIVAALLAEGSVPMTSDELAGKVSRAVAQLRGEHLFRGLVRPLNSPGTVSVPTVVAACTGGTYRGYSSIVLDQFTIALFVTEDGAVWRKVEVFNAIKDRFSVLEEALGIDLDPNLDPKYSEYFTIEAKEGAVVKLRRSSFGADLGDFTVEYSTDDGQTWTEATATEEGMEIADLSAGEKVLIRGKNERYGGYDENESDFVDYANFVADGECYVYGNIMSLVGGDEFARLRKVADGAFAYFFHDYDDTADSSWVCKKAGKDLLLPATTLAQSCYSSMFYGCTGLTEAPELPATTLAQSCYSSMFSGCTGLSYIKALFTTTPGTGYTNNWVQNVKATGTFVKSASATWNVTGNNGVPTGWTVETA